MPFNGIVCAAPETLRALSVIVAVPLKVPVVVGVKLTPTTQLDPTPTGVEVVQELVTLPAIAKLVVAANALIVSG